MSAITDKLTADVAGLTTVAESAVMLLGNLSTQLKDAIAANNNGDASALEALSASLEAETSALADAITANTPAAPTV